jgi:hypothetical protein
MTTATCIKTSVTIVPVEFGFPTYHNEAYDDNFVVPCTDVSTPLQPQHERNDHAEAQYRSQPVNSDPLLQLGLALVPGKVHHRCGLEEEEHGKN